MPQQVMLFNSLVITEKTSNKSKMQKTLRYSDLHGHVQNLTIISIVNHMLQIVSTIWNRIDELKKTNLF